MENKDVIIHNEFQFVFKQEDYINYNYFVAWSNPKQKISRIRAYLRPFIIIGPLVFLIYNITHTFGIPEWLLLAIGAILSIGHPFIIKNSLKKQVANIFKVGAKSLEGVKTVVITEEQYITSDNLSRYETDWKAFANLVETDEYFYLFETSVMAHIIPKRVLKTENEIIELRKFLNKKVIAQ